jgi:segregation and condensation protein B
MNESYVRNVIEAALLAAGAPLPVAELLRLFDESVRPSTQEVRAALESLAAQYAGRGIELKETAGGFRIQVRRELAPEISRLWPERAARYSRALLETLALIAYRQPITRAEIEAVRGVVVNPNIIRTLIERNWVRVLGQRDVPGHPELLGTTREFLDYFGLMKLDDLPPLAELKAMGDFNLQLTLGAESLAAPDAAGAPGAPGEAPVVGAAEDDATGSSEEGSDGDELSAEGGRSAELVAAPPALDG